mmetsp:Transcript_45270/g.117171  ORF Transcript_45270/g.117171 Transcript_45270/m.117171 type:complete len:108 (-) Transcript_45270:813-1136(-)
MQTPIRQYPRDWTSAHLVDAAGELWECESPPSHLFPFSARLPLRVTAGVSCVCRFLFLFLFPLLVDVAFDCPSPYFAVTFVMVGGATLGYHAGRASFIGPVLGPQKR